MPVRGRLARGDFGVAATSGPLRVVLRRPVTRPWEGLAAANSSAAASAAGRTGFSTKSFMPTSTVSARRSISVFAVIATM